MTSTDARLSRRPTPLPGTRCTAESSHVPAEVASKPFAAPRTRRGQQAQGERALIKAIRGAAARATSRVPQSNVVRLGIGDDCAIVRPSSRDELIVTTDLFLENVHFRRDWHQPEVAGHRCLARGLSDIAAMGGTPVAAFLSFALPPELAASDWASRFLAGLLRLARLHHIALAGGDTAQSPSAFALPIQRGGGNKTARQRSAESSSSDVPYPIRQPSRALFTADIVVIGSLPRGKALLRSGASPGDLIYVTGALGGAAAELALLEEAPGSFAQLLRAKPRHPHLFPQPRLALGQYLRSRATAAIDLSDGLSTDLTHLCEEASVAADIDIEKIPIHSLAGRVPKSALERALHGGEDYELLFTAAPNRRLPAEIEGTPVRQIGRVVQAKRGKNRVYLVAPDGSKTALLNDGWEHLRSV